MANISEYISKIKTAIYGKDVRGALADGLDAVNKETEAATALAQETEQRQTSIEKQFDDQIANMTLDDPSSAELVAARTNVNTGKSYDTIGRRLDAEHADVTAQLAEKANQDEVNTLATDKADKSYVSKEVSNLQINKADKSYVDDITRGLASGSPKGTYPSWTSLTEAYPNGDNGIYVVLGDGKWYYWHTLDNMWKAGGVYQGTELQDNSVETVKIKDGAVVTDKQTIDIFPRNIKEWGSNTYNATIGEQRTNRDYLYNDSTNYRHDTRQLIKVPPSSELYITSKGNYQVAIWEFDGNELFIADRGYRTGWLTLSENTSYIMIICSTKDYTPVTLEDMLKYNACTVELAIKPSINVNDFAQTKEYPLINYVSQEPMLWMNGVYSNATKTYISTNNRLCLKEENRLEGLIGRIYYSVAVGYNIGILPFDKDNIMLHDGGWKSGSGFYYLPDKTEKVLITLRKIDDTYIHLNDLKFADVLISNDEIPFEYHKDDLVKKLKENERFTYGLSDRVRFIGHAGMEGFGPENTLEAYKESVKTGVWGAECDLGVTADNHLVLMHDYTVDRTTDGTGNVSDLTLAEIKALNIDVNLHGFTNVKVPTIEEYLDVCKKYGLYPIIEVKEDGHQTGMVDLLLPILEKRNLINDCILITFGRDTVRYIRNKNQSIKLSLLLKIDESYKETDLEFIKVIGKCTLNIYHSNINQNTVDTLHQNGLPVMVWTVDDDVIAENLIDMGVDMIITNTLVMKDRYI